MDIFRSMSMAINMLSELFFASIRRNCHVPFFAELIRASSYRERSPPKHLNEATASRHPFAKSLNSSIEEKTEAKWNKRAKTNKNR